MGCANPCCIYICTFLQARFETFWANMMTSIGYDRSRREISVSDLRRVPLEQMLLYSVYTDRNLGENNDIPYYTKPHLESIRDTRRINDIIELWRVATGQQAPEHAEIQAEVRDVPGAALATGTGVGSPLAQPHGWLPVPPAVNHTHSDIPTARCIDCAHASSCVSYRCVLGGSCASLCKREMLANETAFKDVERQSIEERWWDSIYEQPKSAFAPSLRESVGIDNPKLDHLMAADKISDEKMVIVLRQLLRDQTIGERDEEDMGQGRDDRGAPEGDEEEGEEGEEDDMDQRLQEE